MFNINTPEYWDSTYRKDFDDTHGDIKGCYRYNEDRMNSVLNEVKDYAKVLDVGCGLGFFSKFAQERGKIVDGTDHSAFAVENIKKEGLLKGKFFVADCYELPCKDNEYDAITAQEFIEHLDDPAAFLKEMARVAPVICLATPLDQGFPAVSHSSEHVREYGKEELEVAVSEFYKNVTVKLAKAEYGIALIATGSNL